MARSKRQLPSRVNKYQTAHSACPNAAILNAAISTRADTAISLDAGQAASPLVDNIPSAVNRPARAHPISNIQLRSAPYPSARKELEMSKEMRPKTPPSENPAPNPLTGQERRAARLADELRANLKRRKAAVRTKAAKTDEPATED